MSAETISIIFQSITLLAVFAALWQLVLFGHSLGAAKTLGSQPVARIPVLT